LSNKLKISYIVTRSDTIGGSHIHILDIAEALIIDGYEVSVIIGGNGPIIQQFIDRNITTYLIPNLKRNLNPIGDLIAYHQIKKTLRRLMPDVVSTHSSKAGFLGRIAAKSLKLPVLFTAHGWSFTTGKKKFVRKLYQSLERAVLPMTDMIITVSEYDRNLALTELSVPADKVMTIHNGMKDIHNSFISNQNTEGIINIVMIARFDEQKNHIELLNSVYDIENIHLHFIGDGPLMNTVMERAKELGLDGKITFWGRLETVEKVLSECQIFTLISNWEGFPRSTLEAMRAGMPVIVTDAGGASEAVEHGISGYIVQKGDTNSIKKFVRELVNDHNKRKWMGINARKRYERLFSFDSMYNKTVLVYKEILDNERKNSEKPE
jgi:glycosyltransferase involved in cell wall biosynthesis